MEKPMSRSRKAIDPKRTLVGVRLIADLILSDAGAQGQLSWPVNDNYPEVWVKKLNSAFADNFPCEQQVLSV